MIEEITYGGWKKNLRLSGATTEMIITLEVGPRVMHYAFKSGANVFFENPSHLGGTREEEWQIRGGHRFWTAPEADHSYHPDNSPVSWKPYGKNGVELIQDAATSFGFQRTMRVEILRDETVRIAHALANIGDQPLEITPWALSVMRPGGVALIPQPSLDVHPTEFPPGRETLPVDFLPNRELVLWPFTDLTDGRFTYSKHFLRVSSHPTLPATKIGLRLPSGWVAYAKDGIVFAKHFALDPSKSYPDRNSNFELFTNVEILELESLAPLSPLKPGEVREHVEHWVLRKSADLDDEAAAKAFFEGLPVIA